MLKRQLAAAPLTLGVMLELRILLGQVDDGIVTLIDLQLQPVALDAALGDPDAGCQTSFSGRLWPDIASVSGIALLPPGIAVAEAVLAYLG